jgi:hypothetical protein
MTRRSREPGFAGGDGRFADYVFAFVKVSFLFADMDDNFWWPRKAIVIPIAGRPWCKRGERMFDVRWHFFAAAKHKANCACGCDLQQRAKFHRAAHSMLGRYSIQSQKMSILDGLEGRIRVVELFGGRNGIRPSRVVDAIG